jgi:hypothetical protein
MERALTPSPSIVFIYGLITNPSKSLGVRSIHMVYGTKSIERKMFKHLHVSKNYTNILQNIHKIHEVNHMIIHICYALNMMY